MGIAGSALQCSPSLSGVNRGGCGAVHITSPVITACTSGNNLMQCTTLAGSHASHITYQPMPGWTPFMFRTSRTLVGQPHMPQSHGGGACMYKLGWERVRSWHLSASAGPSLARIPEGTENPISSNLLPMSQHGHAHRLPAGASIPLADIEFTRKNHMAKIATAIPNRRGGNALLYPLLGPPPAKTATCKLDMCCDLDDCHIAATAALHARHSSCTLGRASCWHARSHMRY